MEGVLIIKRSFPLFSSSLGLRFMSPVCSLCPMFAFDTTFVVLLFINYGTAMNRRKYANLSRIITARLSC